MNTFRNKQFKNELDPKYAFPFMIVFIVVKLRVILKSF